MDLNELLSGTDFEGISSGELLAWARGRSDQLIASLPPRSELGFLLPEPDRIARPSSAQDSADSSRATEIRESANGGGAAPDGGGDDGVESLDDEVEIIDDVELIEDVEEVVDEVEDVEEVVDEVEDVEDAAEVVETPADAPVELAPVRRLSAVAEAVSASIRAQPMPPAPPPREPQVVRGDDYASPVLERARDSLEFGIPDEPAEPVERADEDGGEDVGEDMLFSPEERESIGFAIDDALSAAIVEGIPPEESWKLPMEFQDTSGFKQIGHLPEASFAEPAEPGSSGNFERGIPDESGTFVVEEAANEPSGPFQAAVGSAVASLAFLQDDDD